MRPAKSILLALGCWAMAGSAAAAPASLAQPLEQLARRGNGEADYHLGMIYHLGLEGQERDPQKALLHFRRAAAAGDALGAYKLGCFYAGQGDGAVPPDPELALRNKLVAAEAGYDLAQSDVGNIYAERGDLDAALRWFNAAARQGDMQATAALFILHGPEGPSSDPVKAALYRALMLRDMTRMLESLPKDQRPAAAEIGAGVRQMFPLQVTSAQQEQAERLLATWQEQRTPISLKADMGLEAARRLVQQRR